MSASIRGDKQHIRILKDGEQVALFTVTGFDHSEDSQNIESYYAGQREPETDTLMMGFSGSMTTEVKNEVVEALIQEIRDARKSGSALPQVQIVVSEIYPDGSLNGNPGASFLFTDVQLIYSSRRAGGANEKIVKTLSFKAADMVIV